MSLSENIKRFRLEAGYTQEQLAEILGVSSQAVSKWERSETYPDGALLVPIANALGASLDKLFYNNDVPQRSVMTGLLRLVNSCPRDDVFKLGRMICWQIECGMFGVKSVFDLHELEYDRNSSTITGNHGFTWASNGDTTFFAIFEERDDGWSNLFGDGEQIRGAFECLGHIDTMKAILYLYKQEIGFVFESAFLGKECGFNGEQTEHVLADLKYLGICQDAELDGEKRTLWAVWQKQLIIALMVVAKELFFNGVYSKQAESRVRHYLRNMNKGTAVCCGTLFHALYPKDNHLLCRWKKKAFSGYPSQWRLPLHKEGYCRICGSGASDTSDRMSVRL